MTTKRFLLAFAALSLPIALAGCPSPIVDHRDPPKGGALTENPEKPGGPGGETPTGACPLVLEKQALCASLTWEKKPAGEDPGELTVRFWKRAEGTESGPYVTPAGKVAVKLWMPTMGHGSTPVKVAPKLDAQGAAVPGVYSATEVGFVMGGKWEVWLQLKDGAQVTDQAKIDVEI
jgi:hypothetical protein